MTGVVRRIYGVGLATAMDFANRVPSSGQPADVQFSIVDRLPVEVDWQAPPAYTSPILLDSGVPYFTLHMAEPFVVLRFTEVSDFAVGPRQIWAVEHDPDYGFTTEIHLLGTVLAVWLERAGRPALHASAVVVDGAAMGFMSGNRGGKTSVAAALMERGHRLLTDDILAIDVESPGVTAQPGYPQMRMWPQEAERFIGGVESLPLANPAYDKRRIPVGDDGIGAFDPEPRPLAVLYRLVRRPAWSEGRVAISALSGSTAVMELLEQSFTADFADRLGLRAERLATFASVVRAVPVRRVEYAAGPQLVNEVCDAILHDAGRL